MADRVAAIAHEFSGQFTFARVDIDEQQELRDEYAITNVPTLKVFSEGKVVYSAEGPLGDAELRALLKSHGIARQSDELRMHARELHMAGETVEAVKLLTQAIQQDPANTRVAMDMVQIFIDINELEQATGLFNRLPDKDKESLTGTSLLGQLTFLRLAGKTDGKEKLLARIAVDPDDHDAHFDLAVCLIAEHDYKQAVDHLFMIHEQAADYRDGAAREMIINLSNILMSKNPEMAKSFRRRLGNIDH